MKRMVGTKFENYGEFESAELRNIGSCKVTITVRIGGEIKTAVLGRAVSSLFLPWRPGRVYLKASIENVVRIT